MKNSEQMLHDYVIGNRIFLVGMEAPVVVKSASKRYAVCETSGGRPIILDFENSFMGPPDNINKDEEIDYDLLQNAIIIGATEIDFTNRQMLDINYALTESANGDS